jgi:hypothetical protein
LQDLEAGAYYTKALNDKDNELNNQELANGQLNATIAIQNNFISQLESNLTNPQNTLLQYETLDFGEFNVTSGLMHNFEIPSRNSPAFCGGFGVISVYYLVDDVSDGNFNLTVSLGQVEWFNGIPGLGGQYGGPFTLEPVNSVNITIVRNTQFWTSAYPQPTLIETKAPYFVLGFNTFTDSPNWQSIWVQVRVFAYLRS